MNKNIYLMRTFRFPEDDFGNILKVGAKWHHPQKSHSELVKSISEGQGFDDAIVYDNDSIMHDNTAPDQSYSAIGYSDPHFSLYPLFSAYDDMEETNDNYKKSSLYSITKDKSFKNVNDSLPILLRMYVEKFGPDGLINFLKNFFHDRNKKIEGEYYDPSNAYDADIWHDNGAWQAYSQLNDKIQDKLKYTRALSGIKGYAGKEDYDNDVIGIIEAPLGAVLTANDKLDLNSAEQDGPEEYRVNDFTIKQLYKPSFINNIIKKYFDNNINNFLMKANIDNMSDKDMNDIETRSKKAISEIINKDADILTSDRRLKIIKGFVNSFNNNRLNSNIVHTLNSKRY